MQLSDEHSVTIPKRCVSIGAKKQQIRYNRKRRFRVPCKSIRMGTLIENPRNAIAFFQEDVRMEDNRQQPNQPQEEPHYSEVILEPIQDIGIPKKRKPHKSPTPSANTIADCLKIP